MKADNLYDIITNNPAINITISAGQLKDAIDYCVLKTRKEYEQEIVDAKTERYLSVEKTAEILDVHRSTLYHWVEKDYLVPIEIGGKRRYKLSDIKRILDSSRK
jgi:excisionase family DNA binding protein